MALFRFVWIRRKRRGKKKSKLMRLDAASLTNTRLFIEGQRSNAANRRYLAKAARRSWLICASPSLRVACHIEDASARNDGSRSEIQLSKNSRDGMGACLVAWALAEVQSTHSEAGRQHSRCARALRILNKPCSPHREQVSDQVSR